MTVTIDERTQRLREAIAKQDKKYLEDYERGMDAGTSGHDKDYDKSQAWIDGYTEGERNYQPDYSEGHPEPGDEPMSDSGADGSAPPDYSNEGEVGGMPVQVGFHPLGGISVMTRQLDGTVAQARITHEQAWIIAGHLNSLVSILIHATIAQMAQMQQTQPDLIVPGR